MLLPFMCSAHPQRLQRKIAQKIKRRSVKKREKRSETGRRGEESDKREGGEDRERRGEEREGGRIRTTRQHTPVTVLQRFRWAPVNAPFHPKITSHILHFFVHSIHPIFSYWYTVTLHVEKVIVVIDQLWSSVCGRQGGEKREEMGSERERRERETGGDMESGGGERGGERREKRREEREKGVRKRRRERGHATRDNR